MAGPEGPAYMRKDGYFMKAMKRRLLSLLLAMAMVCSLVPSALAAELTATISVARELTLTEQNTVSTNATVSLGADTTGFSITSCTWSVDGTTVTGDASGATLSFTTTGNHTVAVSGTATKPASEDGSVQEETKQFEGTTTVKVNAYVAPETVAGTVSFDGLTSGALSFPAGSTTSKQVTATVNPSPVGGTLTQTGVDWTIPANTCIEVSGTNSNTITITPKAITGTAQEVTITATAKAKGANNATVRNSFTVTVNPPALPTFTITATPTSIAANGQATLTIPNATSAGVTMPSYDSVAWDITENSTLASLLTTTTSMGTNTLYGSNKATSGTVAVKAILSKDGNPVATGTVNVTVGSASTVNVTLSNYNGFTPSTNISSTYGTFNGYGATAVFTASVTGYASGTPIYYAWSKSDSSTNGVIRLSGNSGDSITLTAIGTGYSQVTVKAYTGNSAVAGNYIGEKTFRVDVGYTHDLTPKVTVYSGSTAYNLSDTDDVGGYSVLSQISSSVGVYLGNYPYVIFTQNTSNAGTLDASTAKRYYLGQSPSSAWSSTTGLLSDVVFIPKTTGTATFTFQLYPSDSSATYYSGLLTVTVTDNASIGDIPYTASIGDDVPFDIGDFEDFYYSKTSRGTLEYVTFSMPSGGYLYSDRSRLSASNATCYVSPRSTQNDLGSVYFSPSGTTASKAGTVRVNFTAYGNRNGNSGVSGTVAITYLNGAAKDISYSTVGGSVTLDPQDFIDAYKEVTGKTAPSNLTIQFQEVPANGTLTYTGGNRDVDLTKSNVRSNKYSTKTTGTYRLNQLTYTGTKGKDTVAYIAYNGSTAQFTGNVVFNGTAAVPTDVVVTYGSTGGQAVVFSQNDFIRANSVMSNAVKVRFVTPANGTLTMNGSSAAGIDVATSLLGSVTYKPKAGFNNNTDRITFVAYDSRNQLVASGSVNITVVGNTSTTTTPGGVTDVSQFKDVSANAWYRNDLDTLVKAGVITGKGEGKFDPKGTVTYGEALKMVLEACNHTAAVGTGSQWAINYKNLAVSNGWISSSIDLNASISRNATAELAAKVMGVAPATSGSPFADEANAYAVALYYTNPQIFYGTTNPNGGKPLFENNKPLLREQVCAVICRVRTYNAQQTTDTMPDGI